ncbi:MAG: serine protease [Acidimicrobiia bacterium]|nr:serine protease [Acidimicrobiia bacterium]
MPILEELPATVALITEHLEPATVAIGRDRRGTAVVIATGQLLTNAHNLRDRTTQVTFADGRTAQASVLGIDPTGDLAVLAADTLDVSPVEWSPEGAVAGAAVFGVAQGRQGLRVTFGLVSGINRAFRGPRGRRITGSIEHTAPLARGSSGGPLVDSQGRLLGINTHRLDEGFYLALPADNALRERVEQLAAGHAPAHRSLGISVAPAHVARRLRRSVGLPERDGLLVRGVEAASPAATAGIAEGDLIVAANNQPIAGPDDLWTVLDGPDSPDGLDVALVRGVDEISVHVSFATADEPE